VVREQATAATDLAVCFCNSGIWVIDYRPFRTETRRVASHHPLSIAAAWWAGPLSQGDKSQLRRRPLLGRKPHPWRTFVDILTGRARAVCTFGPQRHGPEERPDLAKARDGRPKASHNQESLSTRWTVSGRAVHPAQELRPGRTRSKRPWSSGIRDVQEKETAGGRQGPPAPAPETAAPRGDGAASVLLRSSPSPSRKILPPSLLPPSSLPPGHATAAPVLSVLPPCLSFLSASIAWLADRAVRSLPSGRLSFTSAPSGLPEPRFPFVLHHIHHRCSPRTSRPLDDQLREVDRPMRKRDSPSA